MGKQPHFIGRIHNEEVLDILIGEKQFCIDEEEEVFGTALTQNNLKIIKKGSRPFTNLFTCKSGSVVLFLGTSHWQKDPNVSGKTVIGCGWVDDESGDSAYEFVGGDYWRHRLRLRRIVILKKEKEPGFPITLHSLGIRANDMQHRFYQDKQGIVEKVLALMPFIQEKNSK